MDDGRPDGVSSSPNDKSVVQIRIQGAAGEVALLDLSDGSSFYLPANLVAAEALSLGQIVSEADLERLQLISETFEAKRKALDLLALREQSRQRLSLKLTQRGFGPRAIAPALDDLESSGALDDLRFAELWVSGRARRNPCGRMKLYAGLLNQGVSRQVATRALSGWNEEEEQQALREALVRVQARSGMTREKTLRALVSKGFAVAAVRRALDMPDEEW